MAGLAVGAIFDVVGAGTFEADGAAGAHEAVEVGVEVVEDALGFGADGGFEVVAVQGDKFFAGLGFGVLDDLGEDFEDGESGLEIGVAGEGRFAAGGGVELLGGEVEGASEVYQDAIAEVGEIVEVGLVRARGEPGEVGVERMGIGRNLVPPLRLGAVKR